MGKIKSAKQAGFTLLELTGTLACTGLLVAILLPNCLSAEERARIANVKANMHALQTMIETQAIQTRGAYAADISALKAAATRTGQWQDFGNPFTGQDGHSYADIGSQAAGVVEYEPIASGSKVMRYYIYGNDRNGAFILEDGKRIYLSNG
ncbi:MAG: type IV pilin protein [Candidatus Sericytochromatia bacterium]